MFSACLPSIVHTPHHLQVRIPGYYVDMSSRSAPIGYNSSSGSQSPTSPSISVATSSNPSPSPNYLMLSRNTEAGEPEQTSPTRNEGRVPSSRISDLHSPIGNVRGGCWTCRLRRKKCDEERIGDSCRTCIRLKIECLGWGTRRPEWMRDKAAVDAYKAGIKAKLNQAGMIRGVPRTPASSIPPIPSSSQNPLTQEASFFLPGAPGPGPPGIESPHTVTPTDYFHDASYSYSATLPITSNDLTSTSVPRLSHMEYRPGPSSAAPFITIPQLPTVNSNTLTTHSTNPVDRPREDTHATNIVNFIPPDTAEHNQQMSQTSLEVQLSIYYFNSVLPVQYIFASHNLTNLLHEIIVQDPQGAVSSATCALASLHHQKLQFAQGLQRSESHHEHTPAAAYYDSAFWKLANSRTMHNQYSETDAIAALHLISYSLFLGGLENWQVNLDIACEWLANTQIDENPELTLQRFSPAAKFAARATMWMDILSSITLARAPRFQSLYCQLYNAAETGSWVNNESVLQIENLVGCPDEVMLAFAEISSLAHWKATERQLGSLSVRELVRRGNKIEDILRRYQPQQPPEQSFAAKQEEHDSEHSQYNVSVSPTQFQHAQQSAVASGASYTRAMQMTHSALPDTRSGLKRIYHLTAVLYLYTVLNDANPGVLEIYSTAGTLIHAINNMPPTLMDRTIVFSMFLAGCMTNQHQTSEREIIRLRFLAQDESFGNTRNARLLMESVWNERENRGKIVDWQEVMRDMGLNLLLA